MDNFTTKDSGERVEFSTGMQRDTSKSKPRFDLITPKSIPYEKQMLTRWAELMARGAEKYSILKETIEVNKFIKLLIEKALCQNVDVIQIERFMQKGTVDHVMKKDYEKITLSLQKDSEEIESIGEEEILIKLKNLIRYEQQTPIVEKEINIQNGLRPSELEDLPRKQIIYYWKNRIIDAPFAINLCVQNPNILIMTIKQGLQEVIYVMGAIDLLECLKTLLNIFKEQLNILKNLQLRSLQMNNLLEIAWISNRNWEKASTQDEIDRFKESAFRHFMQWFFGENDEDHAAAVFFNITGAEYTKEIAAFKRIMQPPTGLFTTQH